jgi:hypothetical protein
MLNESKRDDLLLPYLEILKSKGINCTLGQFKSYMLRKLTSEAGMRNLSLSSNYYLAGAIRYYFNGDLTFNNDLAVFSENNESVDEWNQYVCQRLNALINILRNAYIDTIGETFEQPEDFGKLKIEKLLKKYDKKISKELTSSTAIENLNIEKKDDGINRDSKIGNDYTFDIIYSFKQANQYHDFTEPGAWCITYSIDNYNGYIKKYNVHYVILRKNGWENVPRVKGPEWTREKPQDEYGCSLIALLQSNENGEPVIITSRWNHGNYTDDSKCEADHAFTKEELFQKTGMTDADLQRIFEIWKNDKTDDESVDKEKTAISKEEKLKVLRTLKFAQIRINGGDLNVSNYIEIYRNLTGEESEIENVKITKGVYWCKTAFDSDHTFYFMVDRGKIIFDTIMPLKEFINVSSTSNEGIISNTSSENYNNLVIIINKKYILLYDLRRRTIINVDGVTKFKSMPRITVRSTNLEKNKTFYELKRSDNKTVLMNLSTNQPLMLPNGDYWCQFVRGNGVGGNVTTPQVVLNNTYSHYFGSFEGSFLEICCNLDFKEQYFYDIDNRRFLDNSELPLNEYEDKYLYLSSSNIPGYIGMRKRDKTRDISWYERYDEPLLVFKNKQQVSFNGVSEFLTVDYVGNDLIYFRPFTDKLERIPKFLFFNIKTNEVLKLPNGEDCATSSINFPQYSGPIASRCIFISVGSVADNYHAIFDKWENKFLINPINYPNYYLFQVVEFGNRNGGGIVIKTNDNPVVYRAIKYHHDDWKNNHARLYMTGIDNYSTENISNRSKFLDVIGDPNKSNNDTITSNDLNYIVNEVLKRIINKI